MKALFLVVDRRNVRGLAHWANELEKRNMPAVILLDEHTVEYHGNLVKDISRGKFAIGLIFNEAAFWDENDATQWEIMNRLTDKLKACIGALPRLFGSKYFAYNESTLRNAERLGFDYVLARGTTGARAVIYKPKEFKVKVISVSNVSIEGIRNRLIV